MTSGANRFLDTGVLGLDAVLGGGVPEGDLLLVVGPPGSGKTTLAIQTAFHVASTERVAVYISTLSEPTPRLLRHMRGFSFYDERLIGKRLFFESIYPVIKRGVDEVLRALVATVKAHGAQLLVLDGLRTIHELNPGSTELRTFVHDLGAALAPLGCTTLITSTGVTDMRGDTPPEFTLCDGILELGRREVGTGAVRTIQAWKMRGAAPLLGRHTLRFSADGLTVYPRVEAHAMPATVSFEPARLSTGSAELDAMMSGGLSRGSVTLVAGAPGTGKTLIALKYLLDGARHGQKGLFIGFRESERQLVAKARVLGMDLEGALRAGLVTVSRHLPIDLVIDEVAALSWAAIERTGAERLVIDSVVELEHMVDDERRLRGVLTALTERVRLGGLTALFTREMGQVVGPELDFADSPLEVLSENLLLLRHVEFKGKLRRIVSILKMRDAAYDASIRQYEIGSEGLHVLPLVESAEGLLTEIARLPSERRLKRRAASGAGRGTGKA